MMAVISLYTHSQSKDSARVVAQDSTARLEVVAKDIYLIRHANATDEWPHSNTGIIIGDMGVMIIDATYLPSRAAADIALLKKITNKPVLYLAITHWHMDHTNGAGVYKNAYPDMSIVSEKENADFIELNQAYWSNFSNAPMSPRLQSLKKLEEETASKRDAEGRTLTPQQIEENEKFIALRKSELQELKTLTPIRPDKTFEGMIKLNLGNREVILQDWGRANSPHDVSIYVPDGKVLFTGDMLVQTDDGNYPFVGASWPVQWEKVLTQIGEIPATLIVPGHGAIQHDHNYLLQMRELLHAANTETATLVRQGFSLEEIQKRVKLEKFQTGCWDTKDTAVRSEWSLIIKTLVDRCFKGVRGQGG